MDKQVAIIGSGISGLAAAYTLRERCRLTLYEKNDHWGGHARSITVQHAGGEQIVDTAFMVYNRRNYPKFSALLDALEVRGRDTEMSFSVTHDPYHITYNGGSLGGLFAERRNLFQPRFGILLWEILRFNRLAKNTLQHSPPDDDVTLAEFLQKNQLRKIFIDAYLLPMGASIWSCSTQEFSHAPAYFVLSFFNNHGLLDLINRPQWQHISGGSQHYVNRLLDSIPQLNRRREEVTAVSQDGIVRSGGGERQFDHVVIAAHAPQALALLPAASEQQQNILGAFRYTRTQAVLHTDRSLLPAAAKAHASWNYRVSGSGADILSYPTYSLSRLQHIPGDPPLLLTLNPPPDKPQREHILDTFEFSHPLPDVAAIKAQQRFAELNSNGRLYFCGAYWGNGFHEDGVVSGEAAAKSLLSAL